MENGFADGNFLVIIEYLHIHASAAAYHWHDTDMTRIPALRYMQIHAHTYYTVAQPSSLWMIDRALTQADSDFQY